MSTLELTRWEGDPDALAAAALEAPRCMCERPVLDGDECGYCGREIREPGTLGREFRKAAYDRRLRWARGAGLDPRRDFRGVHDEVGANPELPTLDAALSARVEALAPAQGDPRCPFDLRSANGERRPEPPRREGRRLPTAVRDGPASAAGVPRGAARGCDL